MIHLNELDESLATNSVVKLYCESLGIKALAKICWIKEETEPKGVFLGLRYLSSD